MPDQRLLVSVVIPTKNRSTRVAGAIHTALAQTLAPLEVIVVDDGSDDDTPGVLASLAQGEPRLRLIRNDRSLGAAGARNVGIRAARGTLLAFNDDDCTWSPAKLAHQAAILQDPRVAVAYCRARWLHMDGSTEDLGSPALAGRAARSVLLQRNFLGPPAVMTRTELILQSGGFDESLPSMEDWDLWLRLSQEGEFRFTSEDWVESPMLPDGLSARPELIKRSCHILAEKWAAEPSLSDKERAHFQTALGHVLLMAGASREGRQTLVGALGQHLLPRTGALLLLSLLGSKAYQKTVREYERLVVS